MRAAVLVEVHDRDWSFANSTFWWKSGFVGGLAETWNATAPAKVNGNRRMLMVAGGGVWYFQRRQSRCVFM
jgi:lysozyme family protein